LKALSENQGEIGKHYVGIEVLTAVTLKSTAIWDVARHNSATFRGTFYLCLQGRKVSETSNEQDVTQQAELALSLKMEAVRSSESSVNYRTTQRRITEDGYLICL
jgi:hypothetical protein